MKIPSPKRLKVDDFDEKDRPLVELIAAIYNPFIEDMYNVLSKNISVADNLSQEYKTIADVQVDASGKPLYGISFKNPLKTKLQGIQVVRATGSKPPLSQPFASFIEDGGVVKVTNISGLEVGYKYTLTMVLLN